MQNIYKSLNNSSSNPRIDSEDFYETLFISIILKNEKEKKKYVIATGIFIVTFLLIDIIPFVITWVVFI